MLTSADALLLLTEFFTLLSLFSVARSVPSFFAVPQIKRAARSSRKIDLLKFMIIVFYFQSYLVSL
jgi:hypothetical protein